MNANIDRRLMDAALPWLRQRIDRHFRKYPAGHIVHGRAAVASDIVLSGSDYLAIGNDPKIVQRQIEALAEFNDNIFMSGVYTQYLHRQLRLVNEYAYWIGAEATVLCLSGFAANEGLL